MEHIVQFGISIDDEIIANRIEENAEKEITDRLYKRADEVLFDSRFGQTCPTDFAVEKFDLFLENNRDKIIDSAGKYLAERLSRTKKGKEILNKFDEN